MSCETDKYYRYVARMKPEHTRQVLDEYDFSKVEMINPNNKTYDWDPVRYNDLKSMIIRTICDQSCALLGTQDLLMKNPEIFVERHHIEITKDSAISGRFGIHTDDDGPAGGPCQSILYYYHVDENITESQLDFYNSEKPSCSNSTVMCKDHHVCSFQPITGDVITFHNGVWHCPGNYKTISETPVLRGVIAIFIKHPQEAEAIESESEKDKEINNCCSIM